MNRERLISEMRELTGNASFISASEICAYTSLSPNTVRSMLEGIGALHGRYHIEDVADRIVIEERRRHG